MFFKRLGIAAALLAGIGQTLMGLAVGQSPSVARRTTARAQGSDLAHLSPEAAMMYDHLKQRLPTELNWKRIPWLVDLSEAIRQAQAENRPILLWVSGDDPLERC